MSEVAIVDIVGVNIKYLEMASTLVADASIVDDSLLNFSRKSSRLGSP